MNKTNKNAPMLLSIHYLRAIAALLVVLYHVTIIDDWAFSEAIQFDFGLIGVDIFFVISGFIMYTVARSENMQSFMVKRIVRVVPLYWVCTMAFASLLVVMRPGLSSDAFSIHVLQSLFFIPHFNMAHTDQIWPVLIPGWTLNFEMFFYGLFAIGLLTGRVVVFLSLIIPLLVMLGLSMGSESAVFLTYTSPLLLEFLIGIWLGFAYKRGMDVRLALLLPAGAFAYPLLSSLDLLGEVSGPIARGIFATAIVAGALASESFGRIPMNRFFNLLGNASYSIYLSHTVTVHLAFKLWAQIDAPDLVKGGGIILTALAVSIVIGVGLYYCVEQPVGRAFKARKKVGGPVFR